MTPKRIVIHCTATTQTATVKAIKNYWKKVLKWRSPGYHVLIDARGVSYQLADFNRVVNGVRGYNQDSIHIAYIGGRDGDDRTYSQRRTMKSEVERVRALYGNLPVVGHRDLSKDRNNDGKITPNEWVKLCPNFDVDAWCTSVGL